ncbi:hypothetical protein D3C81_09940 [compost metagenome]
MLMVLSILISTVMYSEVVSASENNGSNAIPCGIAGVLNKPLNKTDLTMYNIVSTTSVTDTTVPAIVVDISSRDWTNKKYAVHINISDSDSGLKDYRINYRNVSTGEAYLIGQYYPSTPDGGGFAIWQSGEQYFDVEAWDNNGNHSAKTLGPYKLDLERPGHIQTPDGDYFGEDIKPNDIVVTVKPFDTGYSGVVKWRYRMHYSYSTEPDTDMEFGTYDEWSPYYYDDNERNIIMTESGLYLIQVEIMDRAGNDYTQMLGYYSIDKDPPNTVFYPDGSWWSSAENAYEVRIRVTDLVTISTCGVSGVASCEYSVTRDNGSTWSSPNAIKMHKVYVGEYDTGLDIGDDTIYLYGVGEWIVRVKMVDKVGNVGYAYSNPYKLAANPVVDFSVKSPVATGEELQYTDNSYSYVPNPDGEIWFSDWRWSIDGVNWVDGKPTSFDMSEFPDTQVTGVYYIQERAYDWLGLRSKWSYSTEVVVYRTNSPPVVTLDVSPSVQFVGGQVLFPTTIRDDAWDSVRSYAWYISKDDGKTWSYPATSTAPTNFSEPGDYRVRFRVYDNGGPYCFSEWSNLAEVAFKIVKPKAEFSINPNTQYVNTALSYTDTSTTNIVGNDISKREWSYSTDNGVTWSTPTSIPTTIFTAIGSYKVRLRVASTKQGVYQEVWSDYCERDVSIIANLTLTATVDINPAKRGQKVIFKITTKGYVVKEVIKFPLELGGNTIVLNTVEEENHTEYLDKIVPLDALCTLDEDNTRLKSVYKIEVTVTNNLGSQKTGTVDLDVKGSVLDNIYTEIK